MLIRQATLSHTIDRLLIPYCDRNVIIQYQTLTVPLAQILVEIITQDEFDRRLSII